MKQFLWPWLLFYLLVAVHAVHELNTPEDKQSDWIRNYGVVKEVADAKGVTLEKGVRHAFVEWWTVDRIQGSTNNFPQCIAGYSHVRLIIGQVTSDGRSGGQFKGRAYDLVMAEPKASTWESAPIGIDSQPWRANLANNGKVVSNQITYGGRLKPCATNQMINEISDQYQKDHPKYSLIMNNCQQYAWWLNAQITETKKNN